MIHTHKTLAVAGLLATPLFAAQEPAIPVGKLFVDATIVEPDVIPNLSWEITHPSTIDDVVNIDKENDTVTTKTKLKVKVSMIGTGITDIYGGEYQSVSEIRFGGGSWEHVFTGSGSAVDQSAILIEKEIAKGTEISFRSRYIGYADWRYNTSSEVQVLVNGDRPPSNPRSDGLAKSAEEYMQPYTKNNTLILGPLDLIYAAELTHTNTGSSGYDMQDSIVLVTFTEVETELGSAKGEEKGDLNGGEDREGHSDASGKAKTNNGHGNNADGVDVSNPGQGHGGPNGAQDTDYDGDGYYEDDENTSSWSHGSTSVGNGGCNRNNMCSTDSDNDWSDYDSSYGSGFQGAGKPKNKSKKKSKKKKKNKKKDK